MVDRKLFISTRKLLLFLSASALLCSFPCAGELTAKNLVGSVSVSSVAGKNSKPVKKNPKLVRESLNHNVQYRIAMVDFNNKRYGPALEAFIALDGTGFCCDLIHYDIGQCFQLTGQIVQAQAHYNWVLNHSQDATLRRYALYGAQTLAYYGNHRTYAGQGNNFDHGGPGSSVAGGGGGSSMGFG